MDDLKRIFHISEFLRAASLEKIETNTQTYIFAKKKIKLVLPISIILPLVTLHIWNCIEQLLAVPSLNDSFLVKRADIDNRICLRQ